MKKEGDKFAARGVPPLAGKKHLSIPGLKFIPTKDKYYLYIVDESDAAKAYVYDLDISCTADDNCPKIGDEKDLAQVFSGVTAFRNVYFQDGFTYFASGVIVLMFVSFLSIFECFLVTKYTQIRKHSKSRRNS